MATEAGVTHFDFGQIYVVHRSSPKESTHIIIIVFMKKNDRKKTFYRLDAKIFLKERYDDNESDQSKTYGPIYLNESLTPQNRLLLKKAQKARKNLKNRLQY